MAAAVRLVAGAATRPLRARVQALQHVLNRRAAEIRALRAEVKYAPHGSAEVTALAAENTYKYK